MKIFAYQGTYRRTESGSNDQKRSERSFFSSTVETEETVLSVSFEELSKKSSVLDLTFGKRG